LPGVDKASNLFERSLLLFSKRFLNIW